MEGKLQFHSHLTLMAQVLVTCWTQFYLPLENTIQWCLGSNTSLIIDDDTVVLDCILNGCCSLRALFHVQIACLRNASTSSNKENPLVISCIMNLFSSSVTFLPLVSLCPFSGASSRSALHHSHLWKFATWRFVCMGLTVPVTSVGCKESDMT